MYIYIYIHTLLFTHTIAVFYISRHLKHLSECNRGTRASRSNNHSPSGRRLKRKRWGISAVSVNRITVWHKQNSSLNMNFLSESFRQLRWCSMSRIKGGSWNIREQSISSFKLCMESLSLVLNLSNWNELIAPGNLNYLRVPWGAFNFQPNK